MDNLNFSRFLSEEKTSQRKFLPNIAKALDKQTKKLESVHESSTSSTNQRKSDHSFKEVGRGSNYPVRSGKSQFVQSYSIFESGVGCVLKKERVAAGTCEIQSSAPARTKFQELVETERKLDPLDNCEAFVTDIKQIFKDPPTAMPDSASKESFPLDPLSELDLSHGRDSHLPFDFFSNTKEGKLFTLQLPDKLLSTDPEKFREGLFGKIQLLENGKARLLVGEASFELICPNPFWIASDVVLATEESDDTVQLNCLGHLEQSMAAVPNLEEFVRLGN